MNSLKYLWLATNQFASFSLYIIEQRFSNRREMMKKRWLLAIGLVFVITVLGMVGCSPGNTIPSEIENLNISSQQEGIWVNGQGKIAAEPDVAVLRLGIEAQATSVAEAKAQADEAMQAVEATLTENGVDKKDIQTQYFNIHRVTKWDRETEEETVVGYRVTNMVTAKIRDMDNVGTVIDAAAEAGGDLTRIDSISFSVDDPSDYYEAARQEAMSEAKAKAEQLAELAGVTLGKPTYISEGSQAPPIWRDAMVFEETVPAQSGTAISPGEIEVTLTVQVVYGIQN
jgi:hypothetical protein